MGKVFPLISKQKQQNKSIKKKNMGEKFTSNSN